MPFPGKHPYKLDGMALERMVHRSLAEGKPKAFSVHSFRALRVSEFKAFGSPQNIPIRPITIIFGPNSAGKSSVLHSLVYLHEVEKTGEVDVRKPSLSKGMIDLGGWAQFHHPVEDGDGMAFELGFQGSSFPSSKDLCDCCDEDLGYYFSVVSLPDEYSDTGSTFYCHGMMTVDGRPLLSAAGHHDDEWDPDFDLSDKDLQATWADLLKRKKMLPRRVGQLDEFGDDPVLEKVVEAINGGLEWGGTGPMDRWAATRGNAPKCAPTISSLRQTVAKVSTEMVEAVESLMTRMSYHGPFREYRSRESLIVEPAMRQSGSTPGSRSEDAWETLFHRYDVRAQVNAWMKTCGTLETGYEVIRRRFVDAESIFDIVLKVVQEGAGILESDDRGYQGTRYRLEIAAQSQLAEDPGIIEAARKAFLLLESLHVLAPSKIKEPTQELALQLTLHMVDTMPFKRLDQLLLIERRTGKEVSLRDIGVGLSQLLPLIVSAFAAWNELILVEQPELHVHPALQAELADVVIRSAVGEQKNTFILETHSEHLLLRILRRIRETTSGSLPDGLVPIRPEDVSVLFVEKAEGGAVVTPIPITHDGDFAVPWPHGFFPERAQELF
ncbi:AAA family ATPase [Mesoterricola silvestris]|uniref:Uncharacterized protein n=1 Tax=Mesoterricola silvestris TaxID=2927979 RepID=A0AA48K7V8_9BACT|nr:DUF3696 domain-containing protein [Mesoterricola silvestris]BDU71556.1 hypothetical protein METEAL_07300 [Mesoterricola silvestris]